MQAYNKSILNVALIKLIFSLRSLLMLMMPFNIILFQYSAYMFLIHFSDLQEIKLLFYKSIKIIAFYKCVHILYMHFILFSYLLACTASAARRSVRNKSLGKIIINATKW